MDYLSLLNLEKEPFSNSPDPDFFFDSDQHLACLQKLELTIRLRQGLSVVLGEVGTGKTTLCRQLIRRLNQGNDLSLVRLLLDPEFGSSREFLLALINEFGLTDPPGDAPDRVLKETIKKFLIEEGAEKKKIIVLLIDEGQKLPGFCLEIVRELLNFETNHHKLLQTVIFAQKEMAEELKKRPNFTDRISTFFTLTPFNYNDTRKMIQHRLRLAGKDGNAASSLFTGPALWVIYRMSKGYPRKIVQLCAKSILSLIIQNKSRVSASLARACAQRMAFVNINKPYTNRFAWAALILFVFLGVTTWFLPYRQNFSQVMPISTAKIMAESPLTDTNLIYEEKISITSISPAAGMPAQDNLLSTINIAEGETLLILITRVYGSFSEKLLAKVMQANPHITNPNRVKAGISINFPAIDMQPLYAEPDGYLIQRK